MTMVNNVLYADDGMLLTDGEIWTDVVFLGTADSVDNWR